MIITAPVTNYIRGDILTANGDRIVRVTGATIRGGTGPMGSVYMSAGDGINLVAHNFIDVLNTYYKGQGVGNYSIFQQLALRDSGIGIGGFTRNSSGNQTITGLGFSPSVVFLIACDSTATNINWSIGWDNVANCGCLNYEGTTPNILRSLARSISIWRNAGNNIDGLLATLDADGFTITFTLVGVCSAAIFYLALP